MPALEQRVVFVWKLCPSFVFSKYRVQKLAAELKAKEEQERKEKERLEKAKQEEEDRAERKKVLTVLTNIIFLLSFFSSIQQYSVWRVTSSKGN